MSAPEPIELRIVRQAVAEAKNRQPLDEVDGLDFIAHTDGSCLRNPDGPSGFAAIIESQRSTRAWEISGHIPSSTNNRAEWSGLAAALLFVPERSSLVAYCDSQYVLNVARGSWKRRANLDLWRAWDDLARQQNVSLELLWVPGHAGHSGNERADRLATKAARASKRGPAGTPSRERPLPSELDADLLVASARGDWEKQFVHDILAQLARGRGLSPKQRAVVHRIVGRADSG